MIKYGCGLNLQFLSGTGTVVNENRLMWSSCLVLNEGRSICGSAVFFQVLQPVFVYHIIVCCAKDLTCVYMITVYVCQAFTNL